MMKTDETVNLLGTDESILLKEMQHRMKNNLQLILSLINLQLEKEVHKANDEFLSSLRQRIHSLSMINGFLSHTFNEDIVDLKGLTESLMENIENAYNTQKDILLLRHIESIKVDQYMALPFGLILNELLTNAFKYAFPLGMNKNSSKSYRIEVILKKENDRNLLIVRDNGCAIKNIPDISKLKSSGLKLVYALTEQLMGTCGFDQSGGTTFTVIF
jgi:two-component sensor histidine kinase